jgi:hypothetical protein
MGSHVAVVDLPESQIQDHLTPSRGSRLSAESAVFLGLLALYLVIAAWLVFGQHSIMEDALSPGGQCQLRDL